MINMSDLNKICIGNVTVITSDNLVLTGSILRNEVKVDCNPFILLTLTEPLFLIPGNAGPAAFLPFYEVGDTVKINLENIVSIGPDNTNDLCLQKKNNS
ncbi:hypothetical protein ACOBQJ_07720 [Pelotomaculum propionicicum]|uniref:hypothetical protein n=1 Tax=Pelotomaculum propionicicum TaxID=258475 RepID=UPI003B76AA11